ncbi:MAG TPA: phytoene desaturase family protein [Ignavibacteria bacterium]|nr:phytoene desaturase family protein [Ignavibacteria bacterium]HMR40181.1 phytoene desaturase family protein [Ignavibacteria bacterium]
MEKIIVCGAGIGGMVSAVYLAHRGNNVEIYEMNEAPGGKMSEFTKDGFRFDMGPSLITMPGVFNEFFSDIGRNMNDYFELEPLECSTKYFWNDGAVFNSYTDASLLSKELTDVFGETERDNFFRYLEYGKLFYDLSEEGFLKDEFKIKNFMTIDGLKNITKFISGRSLNDVSNKFFKNGKLKQLMDRYATFNGSSPYLAPQLFSIIPYVEHSFGAYYVKGGIYKIARSLERLCREFKINIHYGIKVTGFETGSNKIRKIFTETKDGRSDEVKDFNTVISNFTNSSELCGEEYFKNEDWSSSAFILYLGMDKIFSELSHHNILFSDNYEKEFIDIFEKKVSPDDMTIYISISQKDEITDAPDGCENWFVLVNVPALKDNDRWTEEMIKNYMDKIIDRIDSFDFMTGESIRDHIKVCEVFTPDDFLSRYNSEHGSIYGLSSNSMYSLMRRPKNKSSKYDNLFFTGGNTNPGGGVPLCFLSGKIIAKLIS